MAADALEPIERWTAKRRVALVVSLLKGETSVAEAAPDVWADSRRDRRLAGEVSPRCGERAPQPPARRRGREGRADQEAETDDRGSRPRQRYITGGIEALPFGPEDIRRVRGTLPDVSERRSCQVLGVSRAGLHRAERTAGRRRTADPPWIERLREWIQQ